MSMFRSGGYAACDADLQPLSSRVPPTLDACVRCVQVSVDNRLSAGSRPGVHMNVVYFCTGAPSAHWGKVMQEQSSRARRSVTAGTSHRGPCLLCKYSGDDICPLSAGCSS
eukprot:5243913-Pleurochrysis_carterae.AAC.1